MHVQEVLEALVVLHEKPLRKSGFFFGRLSPLGDGIVFLGTEEAVVENTVETLNVLWLYSGCLSCLNCLLCVCIYVLKYVLTSSRKSIDVKFIFKLQLFN